MVFVYYSVRKNGAKPESAVQYFSNPSAGITIQSEVINDPSNISVPAENFANTTEIELTSVSREEVYELVDNEAYNV